MKATVVLSYFFGFLQTSALFVTGNFSKQRQVLDLAKVHS